jgi:iron complex outermembrane receptor protein
MNVARTRALLLRFTALAGSLVLTAPAFAAEVAAAPDAGSKVDEVVVTGTLRSQRLQDAPVAVTAVAATEFTNSGLKDPRELQFLSPSIQVSIQGANAIYIRGSGTNSQSGGTEQSVGMVIDGVLMGFVDDIGGDISDLDHFEVYRGPQGTQFAKNASAGVVSMMTKKPKLDVFEGAFNATYGEHNDTSDNATVNVPINSTMAARFTASFQHRDGVFNNISLNQKQGGREAKGVKGKFLWAPNEKLTVFLSGDARLQYDKPNFPQAWGACGPTPLTTAFINYTGTKTVGLCNGALTTLAAAGITPSPSNSTIVERDDAFRHTAAGGVSAEIDYMLGDFKITSLTAYRYMNRNFHGPSGSGAVTNGFLNNKYDGNQVSEELRLISPAEKKLTYVAGIFLYQRDTTTLSLGTGPAYGQAQFEYPNTIYGTNVAVGNGLSHTHNVNKSYAAYADGSYHFTDKLQMNIGARVTRDDIGASLFITASPGTYTAITSGAPNTSTNPTVILPNPNYRTLKTPATGYTWRIGPQYFVTPDLQFYATLAHGYKGPVIDTSLSPVFDAIKPEEVTMYEAGMKSSWFDHRLTANVTLFYQHFTNYQVSVLNQTVVPNVFQLGNAGGMLSQGGEFEFQARPTPEWNLSAALSVNDAHYLDFVTSCWNAAEPIKQVTSGKNGCISVVQTNPTTGAKTTVTSANAVGTPLINSSKYTYRLGATYTHTMHNMMIVDAGSTWTWRSQWLSAPMDYYIANPGYGILGFTGGVTTPDGRYRVGFFVRNALNTFFLAGRQANNGGYTNVLNPEAVRTIGGTLSAKF